MASGLAHLALVSVTVGGLTDDEHDEGGFHLLRCDGSHRHEIAFGIDSSGVAHTRRLQEYATAFNRWLASCTARTLVLLRRRWTIWQWSWPSKMQT